MSGRFRSNQHAVLVLLVVFVALGAAGESGAVHFMDASGTAEQAFGASFVAVPDLDGDGRDELMVGIPGATYTGAAAGAVFLWYGGRHQTWAPDRIWTGVPGERLGWIVAVVGDVNGDGRPDLALGAPHYSQQGADKGRVLVIYGAADLPASGDAAARADRIIVGEIGGDRFGYSVAAAGDFDGDGDEDMIVGAPGSDKRAQQAGAAYVVYGGTGGPSADLATATCFTGQVAGDGLGWSVTAAGNFLGGSAQSVAVGVPLNNLHGGLDAGAVFVYEGALGGASPDTTIDFAAGVSHANKPGSHYGWVVRGRARWDNDNYDDLAIGAPRCNAGAAGAGRVEVILGDPNPDPTGDAYVDGTTAGDSLGYCLDWVRDLQTGDDDLLIGAPWRDAGGANAGRAYLWLNGGASGNASGLEQLPVSAPQPGTEPDDHYGFWVASAGDFDGDGQTDLAVGAPSGNGTNGVVAGYVHVLDSSGAVVAAFLGRWESSWNDDGSVRVEFALSVPVERVVRLRLERWEAGRSAVVWDGPPADAAGVISVSPQGIVILDRGASGAETLTYELQVETGDGMVRTFGALAGPQGAAPLRPTGLALDEVWPNPANPAVSIRFRAETGRQASCRIYDLRGRLVRSLHAGPGTGDWQTVVWDGRTDAGTAAPSGSYLVLLKDAADMRARRVTLAR